MKTVAMVLAVMVLWTAGEILLKRGIDAAGEPGLSVGALVKLATSPLVISSFLVSGTAFVLWIGLLMRMELGFASYVTSLSYVFLLVGARFFLAESISPLKIVGVGLITVGVICITVHQHRSEPPRIDDSRAHSAEGSSP